jgi:hypothetical protein
MVMCLTFPGVLAFWDLQSIMVIALKSLSKLPPLAVNNELVTHSLKHSREDAVAYTV